MNNCMAFLFRAAKRGLTWCVLLAASIGVSVADEAARGPTLRIPFCRKLPVIDGKLTKGEWDQAAALSMLEAYGWRAAKVMRDEQAVFYICWDREYLYVAMESLETSVNRIMARCTQEDSNKIVGDDAVEFMVSPGAGSDLDDPDHPTYYFAFNSLGTMWDAMFKPLRAEKHNSWQSAAETAHSVEGSRWVMEMRFPFSAMGAKPADGAVWRMNFCRTFFGYWWTAWDASGGLNDARRGGDVTFDSTAPAVRLLSGDDLVTGKGRILMQVANSTDSARQVVLKLEAVGYDEEGDEAVSLGSDTKDVSVAPGAVEEIELGKGQPLRRYNTLTVTATTKDGKELLFLRRDVNVPAPRITKKAAPELPLVYVFPRFLPSLERLAVAMDCTAWTKTTGNTGAKFSADVAVFPKDAPEKRVLHGVFDAFEDGRGMWRGSTQDLPEGEYSVLVRVTAGAQELVRHDDWFEKRIFDWMVNKRGVGEKVPDLYTALKVKDSSVGPWGRDYRFAASGLPEAMISQEKPLLSGPVTLETTVNGSAVQVRVAKAFAIRSAAPAKVRGRAELTAGAMNVTVESATEYDGLTIFRLTYGPAAGAATLNRMRLRIPLTDKYCRFYSASGDREGTSIQGDVLPAEQGRIFDSSENTYAVGGCPTFATLFWVGDYTTYFCYAADNAKGWALRDDAPAVEAYREGDEIVLWLNLVDREITLSEPRTLEFAFQAGPTKRLPEGWRGIQYEGDPEVAPVTLKLVTGGGFTLYGGPNVIHPGLTPEVRAKSAQRIKDMSEGGQYTIFGYHRWPMALKGHPATRVFRGEWGIDKFQWERGGAPSKRAWKQRLYGDDNDLYRKFLIKPVPSYVDYITYAYDEALKETDLHGFYDDTGYPIAVYDEELGLGYVREDGRKISSSGLWIYRNRWQRIAYVNALHKRPNFTADSQHVQAHFQPAYGFIGVWAPCERGYLNHFTDRDMLEFYGSLERYYAYNPSHAFGQVPALGLGSLQIKNGAVAFSRDTRCMVMMAMLHDQDLGRYGVQDLRCSQRLREARNVFRPWEKDISFTGFWEDKMPVRADNKDFRVSVYRRPGSALFVIGNIGDTAARSRIVPDWKALGIDSRTARLGNPETGQVIARDGDGFAIEVPRHDVQLVLGGDLGAYAWQPVVPGRDLAKPKTVLKDLSDPLRGPELDPAWTVDVHKGSGNSGFVEDRFCVNVSHYGYGHIRRALGVDNVSVQCMILAPRTGSSDRHNPGLGLWWENGGYARVIAGTNKRKFYYEVSGQGSPYGGDIAADTAPRWYPYIASGVRIQLTPDAIRFLVSTDGKTWKQDHEVKRSAALSGAPAWAILGNGGSKGDQPFFKNVVPQHFTPDRAGRFMFFSNFVVGR